MELPNVADCKFCQNLGHTCIDHKGQNFTRNTETMNKDIEFRRTDFEQWAKDKGLDVSPLRDGYFYEDTDLAWRSWMACAQSAGAASDGAQA